MDTLLIIADCGPPPFWAYLLSGATGGATTLLIEWLLRRRRSK